MTAPKKVTLNAVAVIERDIVDPTAIESGTLYVGLENIESGGRFVGVRPVDAGELASSKFAFTPQHLLYGKLRPYLAKIARPDFEGICSTDILPVLPGPDLDRGYLAWLLLTPEMVAFASSRATGANLPRLSPNALAELKIPLPPLPEQRRIAEMLDKTDALRTKRRAALTQLDTLAQSIFLDMFGDAGENTKQWPIRRISEYVAEFQGGKSLESEIGENVVSRNYVLKISAVTGMTFLASECKPVPDSYEPPIDHFVRRGDLLFSRANTTELVGAVAYVESAPNNLLLPDKLWRFVWRQPTTVEPLFIWALFQTPTLRQEIERRATGTSGSMKNISQEKVFGIPTILPPISIQREFASRLAAVEKLRVAYRASHAELNVLFSALQHRAFRGEL
ncbi:MAG: restriction endonuclease subunit S [Burkholderiales bacterium]